MTQKIIFLAGISGVGKTTFLKKLANEIEFQHLTAGTLISNGKSLEQKERDSMRFSNLDENQKLLISGFHYTRDNQASIVVIDGHVVIDTGAELEKISSNVFKALKIDAIIHLNADSDQIFKNRKNDESRDRPKLSSTQLKKHQEYSILSAQDISKALGIKFSETKAENISDLKQLLLKL